MGEQKHRNKNLTIPNAMSVLRIIIVPFFAYYFLNREIVTATILLGLSALSDALDGFVARKFNQITELGKILDPFADKITQVVIAVCLVIMYPVITPVLLFFFVKEIGMLVLAFSLLRKKRNPGGSKWYGKVATALFYVSVATIVIMDMVNTPKMAFDITAYILLGLTTAMMVYATIKYYRVYKSLLTSNDPRDKIDVAKELRDKKINT